MYFGHIRACRQQLPAGKKYSARRGFGVREKNPRLEKWRGCTSPEAVYCARSFGDSRCNPDEGNPGRVDTAEIQQEENTGTTAESERAASHF